MESEVSSRIPTVAEYYAGKNIFVTGGTGFIGKVFLERVLRSCPDVAGIYCLVRPKKGLEGTQRIAKLCEEKAFDKLRSLQPDFATKVHAIHGDIIDDGLGIKESDRTFLEQNIHIVFHSAATIRFDEHLRLAVQMNILAVRKMVTLAKNMKNLEVFVHLSTAYANCDREYIEETVYPSPVEPQKLIDIIEWMDDATLEAITPKLIGNKPNTYTYTKQMAENLLIQEGGDLPLAIIRPSIVTASWKEPIKGWIDNINGPSGLYIAAGKGLLRTFKATNSSVADIIPVDFPANLMLATAWYTAVMKPQRNAMVYQITSGLLNPFTWGEMETFFTEVVRKNPMEQCFRRPPTRIISTNKMLHDYWVLVSHVLPAYAADLGFMILGKKPRMVKIYNRLHKAMSILEYFTVRTWQWTHDNLDTLRAALSPADVKTFYFDVREVDWESYTENYVMGTKKYILKEDPDNMENARAHLRMLRNIRYVFNTFLCVIFWRVFIAKSQIARNSWYFILSLVYKFVQFFRITSTIQSKP